MLTNSVQTYDITFFVPCYNEQKNVLNTLNAVLSAVSKTDLKYEILVVDDCSRDKTSEIVEQFQREHPQVSLMLRKNEVNLGLGRNYIDGAFIGHGEYYLLINGDNAEPEETISAILAQIGKADMVIPYFASGDNRGPGRRLLSRLFTAIVNMASGYSVRYYNGPVLHRRYNVMRWHPDTHGYAYQAETITRLLEEGMTYLEVEVSNTDRKYGMSKAFRIQNFLSIVHSLLQIFLRRLRHVIFYRNSKSRA
jgi:glycosyltransferase involved in cell wall biosynthesis